LYTQPTYIHSTLAIGPDVKKLMFSFVKAVFKPSLHFQDTRRSCVNSGSGSLMRLKRVEGKFVEVWPIM